MGNKGRSSAAPACAGRPAAPKKQGIALLLGSPQGLPAHRLGAFFAPALERWPQAPRPFPAGRGASSAFREAPSLRPLPARAAPPHPKSRGLLCFWEALKGFRRTGWALFCAGLGEVASSPPAFSCGTGGFLCFFENSRRPAPAGAPVCGQVGRVPLSPAPAGAVRAGGPRPFEPGPRRGCAGR